ncbi:hypothetical protein OU688_25775 (plasmid) [Escherichia coli]|uniref:hypothetical protein n=1 Tax=Escherichia coli TaxID=562 RepID=UPI002380E6EE|nr:hypothetical protein [Escherichia coli]WDY46263.1 hypothetical protein OU688_25775 [Escherichia coli]
MLNDSGVFPDIVRPLVVKFTFAVVQMDRIGTGLRANPCVKKLNLAITPRLLHTGLAQASAILCGEIQSELSLQRSIGKSSGFQMNHSEAGKVEDLTTYPFMPDRIYHDRYKAHVHARHSHDGVDENTLMLLLPNFLSNPSTNEVFTWKKRPPAHNFQIGTVTGNLSWSYTAETTKRRTMDVHRTDRNE